MPKLVLLDRIIGASASFVVTADGNAPFAPAVRRKLLLEIAGTTTAEMLPVCAIR